jgi:hypothetical protein
MGSALAVSFIGYCVVLAREKPLFEPGFQLPAKTAIDRPLLAGSALFGAGWDYPAFVGALRFQARRWGKAKFMSFCWRSSPGRR